MPLLNREGKFKADIVEKGVAETGQNNLTTFTARFEVVEELQPDGTWGAIQPEHITGYFYLEKKDGSINSSTIDALCESLGWGGTDPFWLEDSELPRVQITTEFEEYQGKSRLKVRWLNNENADPNQGIKKSNAAQRTAIANRLGSKLRANAGGTARPAPTPSTPAPTAPKAATPKPAAPAQPASAPAQASTLNEAWALFYEACPDGMADDAREREWYRILGELFPGKDVGQLAAADWQKFADEGLQQIVPF